MIHTHPDRKKLDIMTEVLAQSFDLERNPSFFSEKLVDSKNSGPFSVFAAEILEYVASISDAEDRDSNIGRGHILTLIMRHENVTEGAAKLEAKKQINEVILNKIDEMAKKYNEVQTAFQILKVYLLKPL